MMGLVASENQIWHETLKSWITYFCLYDQILDKSSLTEKLMLVRGSGYIVCHNREGIVIGETTSGSQGDRASL